MEKISISMHLFDNILGLESLTYNHEDTCITVSSISSIFLSLCSKKIFKISICVCFDRVGPLSPGLRSLRWCKSASIKTQTGHFVYGVFVKHSLSHLHLSKKTSKQELSIARIELLLPISEVRILVLVSCHIDYFRLVKTHLAWHV